MHYNFPGLLAATIGLSTMVMSASACADISGNSYCNPVEGIEYDNVGNAGSYNQIIDMPPDGHCKSKPRSFSGPISPLDEEVSVHFRGRFYSLLPYELLQCTEFDRSGYLTSSHTNQKHRPLAVKAICSLRSRKLKESKTRWLKCTPASKSHSSVKKLPQRIGS
jgi:hypothetical protein